MPFVKSEIKSGSEITGSKLWKQSLPKVYALKEEICAEKNLFNFVQSQAHHTKCIPHIFSPVHHLIAHGLIVAQINSAQVVMFLEKAQFFFHTKFLLSGYV